MSVDACVQWRKKSTGINWCQVQKCHAAKRFCFSQASQAGLPPSFRLLPTSRFASWTGVFATALQALGPAFEAASGTKIQVSIGNAGEVATRAAAGEATDLVMTSSAGVKALAEQGTLLADEVVIGRMRLGVAVRSGTSTPDITSTETFRTLLLSAEKIAYIDPNGGGTSGPFFEKMFASLGVADAVHAKAVLCKTGSEIVEAVSSSRAAIGMTQASEIVGGNGVIFAGYLPETLNLTTVYSASIAARSTNPYDASAFLAFVTGPSGSDRLRGAGWDIAQ
jgi:molybdate transport system substrate-binding protein